MAVTFENECVGCADQGLTCMGEGCPHRHVMYCTCDECGDECDADEVYVFEDRHETKMLCRYCLSKHFQTVEQYGYENFI